MDGAGGDLGGRPAYPLPIKMPITGRLRLRVPAEW